MLGAEVRKLGFCTGRQIQQLGQRIDMRFTIQGNQALHAILDVFRQDCVSRRLFFFVFLHSLRTPADRNGLKTMDYAVNIAYSR
jgi:hypothetical protein